MSPERTRVETEKPSLPIGIIKSKQGILVVGIDMRTTSPGILTVEKVASNARKAKQDPGRILNLSEFDKVTIAQADLGAEELTSETSILSNQDVISIRLNCFDPSDGSRFTYAIEEDEILRALTKERGGVAVFEGDGKPEEIALVIEDIGEEGKEAHVIFFHPKEADLGIDSRTGFLRFMTELNVQFMAASLPTQDDIVRNLNQQIPPDSNPAERRWEFIRAIIITHARLADQTGEQQYKDFLDLHMPDTSRKPVFRSRRISKRRIAVEDPLQVNGILNTVLLNHSLPTGTENHTPVTETSSDTKKHFLTTTSAKKLYDFYTSDDVLGARFGDPKDEHETKIMVDFLDELVDLSKIRSIQTLHDVIKIIKVIRASPFGIDRIHKITFSGVNKKLEHMNIWVHADSNSTYFMGHVLDKLQERAIALEYDLQKAQRGQS